LSTIPAIGTTLLGLLAGVWIRTAGNGRRVVTGLAVGGAVAVAVALAWDRALPINKNLWTSSYALFTAGLGALLFAACYGTIDLAGWRRAAHPFVVLGSNAIALYVLSGILADLTLSLTVRGSGGEPVTLKAWLYERCFAPLASPVNASLIYALANLAVLYVVLLVMYRRGVFLKV
jgi:predicted acyltransferase